jgi:hypothetical protein
MNQNWPIAHLDPLRRLRVMAATLPATTLAEIVVPAPLNRAWAAAADLETSLPLMIRDFRNVHLTETQSGRLRMDARGKLGQRARFDVVLRPGWCWMQSRLWVGGLAAVDQPGEPGSTRIGFLGGLRIPGAGLLKPIIHSASQRATHQALTRLAEQIEHNNPQP